MRIYVGNLPPESSESTVRQLFSQYGSIHSFNLKMDPKSGNCRGYGFLEMEEQEAKDAIGALDGFFFDGQMMRVSSLVGC